MVTIRSKGVVQKVLGPRRVLACVTLLLLVSGSPSAIEELDSIVAVVNNDVIVRSELEHEIELTIPQLRDRGTELPSRDILERQVLDRVILQRLQIQRAKELGIEVDDLSLIHI